MMCRLWVIVLLAVAFIGLSSVSFAAEPKSSSSEPVSVLTINGAIDPTVAQYIDYGIKRAERDGAAAVLIEINTPGGQMTAMWKIVQSELNSRVPIITYVTPDGARAASAGVFITLAGNLAAMAPASNIGSAHPVFESPTGEEQKTNSKDIMMQKVVNDAVAQISYIAKTRKRNVDWAKDAVIHSVNISADDAVKRNVVNFTASGNYDVLKKASGRVVKTKAGEIKLDFKNPRLTYYLMPWYKEILRVFSDSTVAYLLLLIAIIGIIFEINHPGAIGPGVIGGIALILFLYSLSVLSVNFAGLALIILAIIFFIADIKIPGHGILSVGGIIAFFFGSMMLFGTGSSASGVPIGVIVAGTLATALFFIFLVGLGARALKKPIVTGREGMIGSVTVAKTDIDPIGKVFTEGSWWTAKTDGEPIKKGETVKIAGIDGLTIKVTKATD